MKNKYLFFPILAGAVFFIFNAYYNYNFYHVNSFKILYMLILLSVIFLIFDVGFLGYNRLIKKKIITDSEFPWKPALLFLLPVFCTYPGFFIHYSENLTYNHNYELATELVVMMWMVYVIRLLVVTKEIDKAILIFLSIMGMTMIYIWFFGVLERLGLSPYTIDQKGEISRVKVTYGNINYLAGSLVPILPLFLSLAIPSIQRGKRFFKLEFSSYLKTYQHIFFGLVFLLSVSTLLLTQTRAAISAGGLTSLGFFFFIFIRLYCIRKRYLIIFFIIVTTLLTGSMVICYLFRDTLVEYSRFFHIFYLSTWQGRFVAWTPAISAFLKEPIFGYGLGVAYALFFQHISPDSRIFWTQRSYNHTHSEWLEFLQEGGIFGYIGFFILWGYVFYNLIKIYFQFQKNCFHKRLILGCFFGMLGFFLHGFFSVSQRMIVTNIPQYALLAIAFIIIAFYKKLDKESATFSKFSLITKISFFYKQWYKKWRKLPNMARTQIPIVIIFVIIGYIYIPWARTQNKFVKISKERKSIFNTVKLEKLKKERYDIYAMDYLTRRYIQFRDYKRALKNIQDMKSVMPYYRVNGFLEALCYYYLGNFAQSYQILKDYIKRDNYYSNALSLLQRLSYFVEDKDTFLYVFGLILESSSANNKNLNEYDGVYWNFSIDKNQKKNVIWTDSKSKAKLFVKITFSENYINQIYSPIKAYALKKNISQNDFPLLSSSIHSLSKEILKAGFDSHNIKFIPVDQKENTKNTIQRLQAEVLQHNPLAAINSTHWLPLEFPKIIKNKEARVVVESFWEALRIFEQNFSR